VSCGLGWVKLVLIGPNSFVPVMIENRKLLVLKLVNS